MIVNNHYPSFFQWVVPMVNRYYFSDGHVEEDYVTEIVIDRFNGNNKLVRVDAPLVENVVGGNSLIGPFRLCYNLTDVNLPNATSIGSYAFYGCTGLISISLPNTTVLGTDPFFSCTNLTHIYLDGYTSDTTKPWSAIGTAPNLKYLRIGLTSTGAGSSTTPRVTKNLVAETVVLPSCTTMGNYMFGASSVANANQYIKRVCAPICTTSGTYDFARCQSLELVDWKASSIKTQDFNSCTNLMEIVLRSTSKTTMTSTVSGNAFTGTPFKTAGSGAKIYVPSALINTYKADTVWSAYSEYFVQLEGSKYESIDWYKSLEI